MKRFFGLIAVGIVILAAGYLIVRYIGVKLAEKRATLTLAQVVVNYDDQYGEMAAGALIEMTPGNILPVLESGLDSNKAGCKVRIVRVLDVYEGEEIYGMLTSALGDSDDLVSSTAALALARRQREEVLDLARDRLEYDDLAVAGLSFEIISYFEDGIATEIEKELNCELPDKQPYALQGLVPLIQRGNDRAWALLKKAIGSRFPEVRTKALEIAIELGGGKRAEALNIAVNASDPDLRCVALREMALGDDAEDYIDTLKLALNDVNLKVLFTASWSLLKLRDPAPVEYLRAVLADQRVSIRDKIVAARILARMGAPDGADPMYDIIDTVNMAEDIKLEAAEVLGEYEDKIGMGYLGEAIKPNRPPEVRRKALSMLGLMGDRRAGVLLLEMTKDADESIAVRAAYALTALGDARGIGRLRRLLNSDSVEVRTLAAMGIVTGGDITDIIGEEGYR